MQQIKHTFRCRRDPLRIIEGKHLKIYGIFQQLLWDCSFLQQFHPSIQKQQLFVLQSSQYNAYQIFEIFVEVSYLFGNRQIFPIFLALAFPWIGLYLNILDQHNDQRNNLQYLLLYCCFYLFYLLILTFQNSNSIWFGRQLFWISYNKSVCLIVIFENEILFLFCTQIHHYILLLISLVYSIYKLQFLFTSNAQIIISCLGSFLLFIYLYEIPSLGWNPVQYYTQTIDRTRCYYLPVFSLNWINDLPQLWSIFYPLHGRSYFQIQYLALVDRNFPLLNNLLDIEMQEQQ